MKIQTELTPLVVQAQGSRPGAKVMTAWHQYVKARAGVSDSRTKPADGIAHELFQLMAVEGDQFDIQAVGLLDKQDSDQLSVLKKRLKLRNRLKEQNKKGLKRRMRRLDYRIADITVNSDGQEFQLWDPGVSDIPSQYYAHRALGFLTLKGLCPATIRARALFLLGRLDEVVKTLDAGLKIAASKPAFSCVVLSDALGQGELVHIAQSLRTKALFLAGKTKEAEASFKELKGDTLARRVRRHWVSGIAQNDVENIFSRAKLKHSFDQAIGVLGKSAVGATDLAELGMIERYVDVIQRMQADAFVQGDKLALAAKMRNGARRQAKHSLSTVVIHSKHSWLAPWIT